MNDFAVTGSSDLVLAKFRSSENKKWKIIRSEIQSLLNEILVDYFRLTNYNRIYDNVEMFKRTFNLLGMIMGLTWSEGESLAR